MAADTGSHAGGRPADPRLLAAVPAGAARILAVGVADTSLEALRSAGPAGREVVAAAAPATIAATGGADGLDCILLGGGVLERARDPVALLADLGARLGPEGRLVCAVANAQHHAVIRALVTNDLQPMPPEEEGAGPARVFTLSGLFKIILDAGLLPAVDDTVTNPCPPELLAAMEPLARHLRLETAPLGRLLSAERFIIGATPLRPAPPAGGPVTIVVCCNDDRQLADNLAASPCLRTGRHPVLVVRGASSAAEGIDAGLARATTPLVAVVHQDIHLPGWWPDRLQQQWAVAEAAFGPIGVAGVFGVSGQGDRGTMFGRVVDRNNLLAPPRPLPAVVTSLDEIVLVLPRGTPLRADPALGWHQYGTDLALRARAMGRAAVVLDAPCLHNSRTASLGPDFFATAHALARSWPAKLPITTANIHIAADGRLSYPILS